MRLRLATVDDAMLLFEWRNDALTRRASYSPQPVEWPAHLEWLQTTIDAADRYLYVAVDDQGPLGTVRFDVTARESEISVTIAPDRRGEGQAADLIRAALDVAPTARVVARVKPDNERSLRAFAAAGFSADGRLRIEVVAR